GVRSHRGARAVLRAVRGGLLDAVPRHLQGRNGGARGGADEGTASARSPDAVRAAGCLRPGAPPAPAALADPRGLTSPSAAPGRAWELGLGEPERLVGAEAGKGLVVRAVEVRRGGAAEAEPPAQLHEEASLLAVV